MTSNKSPVFPMPEPHHFNDYGFDPQIDYFQVLEEARKHKHETSTTSIDALQFKLRKPISKSDSDSDSDSKRIHKSKRRWWRNALLFFRRKRAHGDSGHQCDGTGFHRGRALRGSISGPVYITESRSGSTTPTSRTASRPSSGPLDGTVVADIPYISLREVNLEAHHRISTSALPIYLVT